MNSDHDRAAAENRSLSRFHMVAKVVFYATLLILFLHFLLRLQPHYDPAQDKTPDIVDFTLYWAAAKLFLMGDAVAVFDRDALIAAAQFAEEPHDGFRWLYPPFALVVMAPLGLLSYPVAVFSFAVLTLAGLWLAVRRPATAVPGVDLFLLTAPVVIIASVMIGQVTALLVACLVAALWLLRDRQAVLVGLLIAVLSFKPHLGLLIPIALAATGQWRAFLWAAVFTIGLNIAATLATGVDYWAALFETMRTISDLTREGVEFKLTHTATVYGGLRAYGVPDGPAMWIQIGVIVAVACAIYWIWSLEPLSADIKCASLLAAIPLATPHGSYDLVTFTLAAALFLVRAGFGRSVAARIWLFLIWLGPFPTFIKTEILGPAMYLPPIIVGTFAICIAMVLRERSASVASQAQKQTASP